MLIEPTRYQAKKLPQIQASRVTATELQRSMGKEEPSKRNSPEFERRRWSGGECAEERSDLPAVLRREEAAAASST
jgi:hypothetical protein